ncbi:MAG: hypothetical protein IJM54_06515 [Thermoguttaceae bacterium]|nr:hypothetical protein [Thermoguttaceae bacterium]
MKRFLTSLVMAFLAFVSFASGFSVRAEENANERVVMFSAHAPDQITIVDGSGKVLWTIGRENGVEHPQDAAVLEDGNVFFSVMYGARMVRVSDKKELWNYSVPEGTQNPVAQPLDDGYFLVGNEGPCRLLEINAEGKVRREIKVDDCPFKGNHGQFRFCRKTREGTYLFPMFNAGLLREYDAEGKMLRDFSFKGGPVCALRLENGITLTGDGSAVKEIDENDEVVWSFDCVADGGQKPGVITAVSRMKNGSTLLGYYQNDPDAADIIEVTRDKKIVWSLTMKDVSFIAAVQALDKDWKPSPDVLVR